MFFHIAAALVAISHVVDYLMQCAYCWFRRCTLCLSCAIAVVVVVLIVVVLVTVAFAMILVMLQCSGRLEIRCSDSIELRAGIACRSNVNGSIHKTVDL